MSASAAPSTHSRKIKALLAGGLVLGVGTAVTLAAWTDYEWGNADFTAGTFNIQGSTDGTTFNDHESETGAAALNFDVGAVALSPTDTVAAPFVLQTDADTTYDATLEVTSAAVTGVNATALSYGIFEVASFADCDADATATPEDTIVPAGTALDSVAGATTTALSAGADGTAGAPVTLCFQVTADDTLDEGQTNTATWQLTATSVE